MFPEGFAQDQWDRQVVAAPGQVVGCDAAGEDYGVTVPQGRLPVPGGLRSSTG